MVRQVRTRLRAKAEKVSLAHVQGVHDLGMLKLFAAHFGVSGFVYPFLRGEGKEQEKSE